MTKLITYTDGGSRNNPGPAACGVIIKNEKEEIIFKGSKFLGIATNNQAEYEGLIMALEKVTDLLKKENVKEVHCYMDSELIVKQLKKEYRVKDSKMKNLYQKVCDLCSEFDKTEFIHVRREGNKLADKLVNEELDKQIDK